jgi:hypothetical protein
VGGARQHDHVRSGQLGAVDRRGDPRDHAVLRHGHRPVPGHGDQHGVLAVRRQRGELFRWATVQGAVLADMTSRQRGGYLVGELVLAGRLAQRDQSDLSCADHRGVPFPALSATASAS